MSFCGQKVGGKAGTRRRCLGVRSSVRNFSESLGSAASALTARKTAAHVDPRGDLCHLVMSQGWKTLPFFSREIHSCLLAGRGAGSPPAFEAQARSRGHRCPPSVPTVGLPSCSSRWSLASPLVEMTLAMPMGSSETCSQLYKALSARRVAGCRLGGAASCVASVGGKAEPSLTFRQKMN